MLYVLGFIAISWFVYEFGTSILWRIMEIKLLKKWRQHNDGR